MNRIATGLVTAAAVLVIALSAGAAGPLPAVAAPAGATPAAPIGSGVSLRPADPTPANASYFTLLVASGASVHDSVIVTNPTAAAISVVISPVDGRTGQTSGAVYANRQDPVTKAGTWVTPSLSALTLAAGSTRRVAFTVRAPATSAGDHLAGIAFENSVHTTSTSGFPITTILRSVIGVRIVVPGAAKFHPKLTALAIDQVGATGIGAVIVGLGNDGLQLGKPQLTVALVGPAGYQHSSTRALDTILPGDTISYPFNWANRLAAGEYTITATLTGGGVTVTRTQQVRLGAPLAGTTQPLPVASAHATTSWWLWLLAAIGVVAVLAVLLGGGYLLWRRHRHRGTASDNHGASDGSIEDPVTPGPPRAEWGPSAGSLPTRCHRR